MSSSFPEKYLDLFQKKALGAFTTLMPDGSPQTTPVWVDYDGEHILLVSKCDFSSPVSGRICQSAPRQLSTIGP